MPVERIGTDDSDILTITASELEGSIIDGRGGVDILELAVGFSYGDYDFRPVASLAGIERIRGINSSHSVIFSSEQIHEITSFENPNRGYFTLSIEGANVDFRDKAPSDGIDVFIRSEGAVFTVNDLQVAMSVNGSFVTGETLVVEDVVLTASERRALHSRGIDRVQDATGVVTEDLLAPSISGLDGRMAVGPNLRLRPAAGASISEDIWVSAMTIELETISWNLESLSIDESGSVRIVTDDFVQHVTVDGRKVAEVVRLYKSIEFFFNPDATVEDVQTILRSVVYTTTDANMPALPNKLKITLSDGFHNPTQAEIGIDYLNGAPTALSLENNVIYQSYEEDWYGNLQAADPNSGERFTFTLLDDANGQFILEHGIYSTQVRLARPLDPKESFTIKIRVTDRGGLSLDQTITISVEKLSFGYDPDDMLGSVVDGTDAADQLIGGDGNNLLYGLAGNDILEGFGGNDTLIGGKGRDRLTGGSGKDVFVFDTKPSKANIDRITDFSVRDDTIWLDLDNEIFSKLGTRTGTLKKSYFFKGSAARDANDYIIYNPKNGALYYDKDGSGGAKAVQIAILKTKLAMTHKDFFVDFFDF